MESTISIILPSRQRPIKLNNFLQSLFNLSKHPISVEIILCIDIDDNSYRDLISPFQNTVLLTGPRRKIGEITNDGIKKSTGDIIFLCNDDVEALTYGWDDHFRDVHKRYPDGIYLFSPNDQNKAPSLFVFPGFSRRTFKILSSYPKMYSGAFIDTHIHEIFKGLKHNGINRIYFLKDVNFAHRHFRVTGEKPDKVYLERDRFGDDKEFYLNSSLRYKDSINLRKATECKQINDSISTDCFSIWQSTKLYLSGKHLSHIQGVNVILYMLSRKLFIILIKIFNQKD